MKRLTLIIALVISLPLFSHAQEPAIEVGDQFVNFGLGLGSVTFRGSGYSTVIPPLSVSYEKIIRDGILDEGYIGVGAYLGFSSYKWSYAFVGTDWGWSYTTILPGARASFHYPIIENIDTYTGLLLGYQIVSAKETGTSVIGTYNATTSGIAWSWYAGGRYFLSDNFMIMAELGYGITYLNIGVALKLP
jgi:hypothetical protein